NFAAAISPAGGATGRCGTIGSDGFEVFDAFSAANRCTLRWKTLWRSTWRKTPHRHDPPWPGAEHGIALVSSWMCFLALAWAWTSKTLFGENSDALRRSAIASSLLPCASYTRPRT